MDPLWDDSVSDLLVDDDSDGPWVDVEDSASLSMVIFVWHALVNGAVNNDVNDLSSPVGLESL